jgi:hypothetical protein
LRIRFLDPAAESLREFSGTRTPDSPKDASQRRAKIANKPDVSESEPFQGVLTTQARQPSSASGKIMADVANKYPQNVLKS